jgi:hypothetical protein
MGIWCEDSEAGLGGRSGSRGHQALPSPCPCPRPISPYLAPPDGDQAGEIVRPQAGDPFPTQFRDFRQALVTMTRTRLRPPLTLGAIVIVYLTIGLLVLLLAAVVGGQVITWDVKGFLLAGWRLALFSSALAALGALAVTAAVGLWRGDRRARPVALLFWFAAGGLGLVVDRSVAGPGEPLRSYLLDMMLVPGGVAAALLFGIPSIRRYFRAQREQTRASTGSLPHEVP